MLTEIDLSESKTTCSRRFGFWCSTLIYSYIPITKRCVYTFWKNRFIAFINRIECVHLLWFFLIEIKHAIVPPEAMVGIARNDSRRADFHELLVPLFNSHRLR